MDLDNQTDVQLAERNRELQALLDQRLSRSARAALQYESEKVWGEIWYRTVRAESAARVADAAQH